MKIKPTKLRSIEIKGFTFSWAERDGRVLRSCFCPLQKLREEFPSAEEENQGEIYELLKLYAQGIKVALEEVPVVLEGSEFQKRVWKWLRRVKFGEVVTYGEIAKALRTSPRAVGRAMASNRIPLFVPCHRVIARGSLGGFTPDVKIKRSLLLLEGGYHDKNGTLEGCAS